MKKSAIKLVGIVIILSAFFTACTQSEEIVENAATGGEFLYTLHLNCSVPGYSEDLGTRGSSSWEEGSTVYLLFKNGITGTAIYNGNEWTLQASDRLDTTPDAADCQAVYVENANEVSDAIVYMDAYSIIYKGNGTYTVSSSDIYVNVTMPPSTWRLRFKGTNGTKISLPDDKNDIKYYTTLNTKTFDLTTKTEDISLAVGSSGYTGYVYGELLNKDGNNAIYLINETEDMAYYREDISGKNLSVGNSGYLTVPTQSTYASLNWQKAGGESEIDKNDYGNDSSLDEEVTYKLSVSHTNLEFKKDGGNQSVEIETNDRWMVIAASNLTWCSFTPTYGNQSGTLSISVQKNTTSQERAAELIITGIESGLSEHIRVIQEAGGETTIDKGGFTDDTKLD